VTGGKPNLPLAARDHEVQLALNTLKLHDATPGRIVTKTASTATTPATN